MAGELRNFTLKIFDLSQLRAHFTRSEVSQWISILQHVSKIMPKEDEAIFLILLIFKTDKHFQVYFVGRSFETISDFCEFIQNF